jgi:hypothetical protein
LACAPLCVCWTLSIGTIADLAPGAINNEMRQSGPLTGDGLRFATFYTNLHDRLLRPLLAADKPTRAAITAKRIAHY